MEYLFLALTIFLIFGIALVSQSIRKIKRARESGTKLSKRNGYYALVARLFVRDLPE